MQLSDWIIIILYLVAMLGIGFFAKGKIQTMDDFILGGKRFGKVALIGTIVATMVGSGMTMGAVGTAYNNGSTSTVPWMYFGFSVGLIVMGLIAPQVRETNARSIAEIMNIKFGKLPVLQWPALLLSMPSQWSPSILQACVRSLSTALAFLLTNSCLPPLLPRA